MPKPPSSIMKRFRVRIDGTDDERMLKFFKEHSTTFLLVHHLTASGNPHYHAYCETHFTQGNFSNKIKSVLGVVGGDYSNKVCDPDRKHEYLSYLFNTKLGNKSRMVSFEGFSILDIKIAQENANTIANEFAERMKKDKKPQFDMIEMVIERMGDKVLLPTAIYDEVIQVLRLNRAVARPHHIRDMIASVMAWGGDRNARETIKDLTLKYFQS